MVTMATSDRDDALQYLLSKLQSEDGWSCANLAWNEDRLTVIADQFSSFDGTVKSKLLLSFLAMTPRVISLCRDEMLKLLRLARRDGDEWVRLFASVLAPFPDNQTITLEADSNATEVLEEIGEALTSNAHSPDQFIPHEYYYLNSSVLDHTLDHSLVNPNKHFKLRKHHHASSQLRTDVLQRAETDFSTTGTLNRDRTIQRQPSTSSSSLSFVPSQRVSSTPKTVPVAGLMQRRYREKGTKLLEIDEVPMAGRKKRRISEVDGPSKKNAINRQLSTPITPSPTPQEIPTPTPDYAASLGAYDTAIQPHTPSLYNSNFTSFPSLNSPTTPNPNLPSPLVITTGTTSTTRGHPLSTKAHPLAVAKVTNTIATNKIESNSKGSGSGVPMKDEQESQVFQMENPEVKQKQALEWSPSAEIVNKILTSMPKSKSDTLISQTMVKTTQQSQIPVAKLTSTTPTTPKQSNIPNPTTQASIQGQMANIGTSLLGAQNVLTQQARQQILQNQQRIILERQRLLQQIQQQHLIQQTLSNQTTVPQHNTTGLGIPQHNTTGMGRHVPQHNTTGMGIPQHNTTGMGIPQRNPTGIGIPQHNTTGMGMPPISLTPSSSSSSTSTAQQPPTASSQPSNVAKQPSKGLKLSRQQLAVAQEIFREAPQLNKQQKALILAFMAGSRENPLPGHEVISIKLNQRQQQEYVQTTEGSRRIRNVQLETVFEMNYTTGQWRKLQVKRPLD